MRRIYFGVVVLLILSNVPYGWAAEDISKQIGRYQAFQVIKPNSTSMVVFILDTQEGHMWTWSEITNATVILYEGKVKPGVKMRESVDIFEFKTVPPTEKK